MLLTQSILATDVAHRIAREHFLVLEGSGPSSRESLARGQTFREIYASSGVHDGIHELKGEEKLQAEYERARQYPPTPSFFRGWTLVEVNPNVPVPVEVITGPWDEEKKRRLYWLSRGRHCHGGASYNYSEHPWEARLACLDTAVISAEKLDPVILNCLIGPWLFEDVPKDAREPLVNLCNRIACADEMPEMMDTLRYIVRVMDTDWDFMKYHVSEDEWNANIISSDDAEFISSDGEGSISPDNEE
ncbi:hypothetical protein E4U19_006714 [Claviceps sp. Clav32 group G5]|nr:hypothetical protein E4U19_006714 [Claviceps sp. Clav32 group G5]